MSLSSTAPAQLLSALRGSYADFLLSIPMVIVGILITGSIFYLAIVRPQLPHRSLSGWIEYLFPREHYTTSSAKVDLWVWLINGLLVIPIYEVCVIAGGLLVGVSAYDVLAMMFGPGHGAVHAVWAAVLLQFFGFYFGIGLGQYLGHLAFHKVPVLWALHRAHHSAESPNLFAFLRSHPIEIFLNGATRVLGAAAGVGIALYFTGNKLLPGTTTAIVWYNIVYVLIGFRSLDHTHIPIRYGKLLDVLVGSPIMHEVHHSAELRHRDVNLAGAGYIYDWLFGTLYVPRKAETWRWGLNETELGARNPHMTVRSFFLEPLAAMSAQLGVIGRRFSATPSQSEKTAAEASEGDAIR
jgi:sterol desaturase/sphingolipid hydroxylase (fatty acid hydroxylase superfamily)